MRIRTPFAIAFLALCLLAAYLGFSNFHPPVNDKFLHFITFLILTVCFYWVVDTSRRRVVNFTLGVCTLTGGVGSEFVQSVVSSREFDPLDIVSNLIGSALGLLLCAWYHRRMLERRRLAKSYQSISTAEDVEFDQEAEELHDIEAGHPPDPVVEEEDRRNKD
ncbi:hypothetical protein FN846DRAFT_459709 [Sphaerosporella brunnea]|uniref:VanZ-like domain-containing protein n=1 Tax=Sphaerosporella brunnea TaxID=1250544 RepID=A0A5J5EGQ4_9PEZI|nr:hypothetical protein FN846DRAFT_459709 [Sphaerosporella brunnea]